MFINEVTLLLSVTDKEIPQEQRHPTSVHNWGEGWVDRRETEEGDHTIYKVER
jgi:hypothetical protein